jgi:4-hydroxybenzoate polyprenyltransferase
MPKSPKPNTLRMLFLNHMDAWGLTFVIISLFLLIHDVMTLRNISLMLAITTMYWLGFAVNDYYDVPYDAVDSTKSNRNAFILDAHLKRSFRWIAFIVSAFAFAAFAQFGWRGVAVFCFSVLILWGYSAPPLRLKSRPLFDLITHVFFVETYPYLVCLLLIAPQATMTDVFVLAFFGLASMGAQLEQQIRDYAVDRQFEHTFTTTFGIGLSSWILKIASAGLFVIGTVGLITGIFPLWMFPYLAMGTPPVLHRFFRPMNAPRPERLIRWTAISVLIYTGILWIAAL